MGTHGYAIGTGSFALRKTEDYEVPGNEECGAAGQEICEAERKNDHRNEEDLPCSESLVGLQLQARVRGIHLTWEGEL